MQIACLNWVYSIKLVRVWLVPKMQIACLNWVYSIKLVRVYAWLNVCCLSSLPWRMLLWHSAQENLFPPLSHCNHLSEASWIPWRTLWWRSRSRCIASLSLLTDSLAPNLIFLRIFLLALGTALGRCIKPMYDTVPSHFMCSGALIFLRICGFILKSPKFSWTWIARISAADTVL